jgi:protein-tyrosine phosphatase
MFDNVMMVCIGNICRSPIAEVYLKHHQPQLNVFSSGLGALVGKSADPKSIDLMTVKNIDLTKHCAQQINSVLVSKADLILTMEQSHIDAIQSKFPEARGKVHLICKWDGNQEIPDPYKKDSEAFASASALIESGLDTWQKKLWK